MLIEFRVENHRSFRDEQAFTMEAGLVDHPADKRPRQVAGSAKPILPLAAIYGANASGKSNLLAAMAFMREAVLFSYLVWPNHEKVDRDPFSWGPARRRPSLFEMVMLIEGVPYQYGFTLSVTSVQEEWLYAWPNRRKRILFARDKNEFQFGEHLKGDNEHIQSNMRRHSLFLSSAAHFNHEQLTPIFSWFSAIRVRGRDIKRDEHLTRSSVSNSLIGETMAAPDVDMPVQSKADAFKKMLVKADVGIVDFRAEGIGLESAPASERHCRFFFKHKSRFKDSWLPLEEQSSGTQAMFRMAWPLLGVIGSGGLMLVDELEASLHPSLAIQFVRQFNDPATNPNNAQLIFTTHDTNLLGTTLGDTALRRDQVWLAEKDAEGASTIYPLTDFKPRKHENLEHGYLQGRYGAIPFLGNFSLTGE
jgi:hypothetical protein